MELPTYTNIWKIEKRLYKLYDFRLPMPLPVGQAAAFLAIAIPYVVILTMAGMPFSHTWVWLYVLPPGILAWLATRPVLEGKRLPELVLSQLRYLSEPRTWCRMAPLAEKDQLFVTARVWRLPAAVPLAAMDNVARVASSSAATAPVVAATVHAVDRAVLAVRTRDSACGGRAREVAAAFVLARSTRPGSVTTDGGTPGNPNEGIRPRPSGVANPARRSPPVPSRRPASSQPAVSRPALSQPAVSRPAVKQRAVSRPAASQATAISQPRVSQPEASQPARQRQLGHVRPAGCRSQFAPTAPRLDHCT